MVGFYFIGSIIKKTLWKIWPRWLVRNDEDERKEASMGKRFGIRLFYMTPKNSLRPPVNTNESWYCKGNENYENITKYKFFERLPMDQLCVNFLGSLLALDLDLFWIFWNFGRAVSPDRNAPLDLGNCDFKLFWAKLPVWDSFSGAELEKLAGYWNYYERLSNLNSSSIHFNLF